MLNFIIQVRELYPVGLNRLQRLTARPTTVFPLLQLKPKLFFTQMGFFNFIRGVADHFC